LVVPESPVVVRCGGLVLWREGHGRGGAVLLREYILEEAYHDNQINDRATVTPNVIFDVIIRNKTPTAARQ
jgi:hypothetical protein